MNCAELGLMRHNAARIRQELLTQKSKMRRFSGHNNRSGQRPGGDMEVFLQRKMQKVAAAIERHIAQHGCHD